MCIFNLSPNVLPPELPTSPMASDTCELLILVKSTKDIFGSIPKAPSQLLSTRKWRHSTCRTTESRVGKPFNIARGAAGTTSPDSILEWRNLFLVPASHRPRPNAPNCSAQPSIDKLQNGLSGRVPSGVPTSVNSLQIGLSSRLPFDMASHTYNAVLQINRAEPEPYEPRPATLNAASETDPTAADLISAAPEPVAPTGTEWAMDKRGRQGFV